MEKSSILDFSIFNSLDPDTIEPKSKKLKPFPLENFDQDIASAYQAVNKVIIKLTAAQENPINHTPARKRRLKSLKYKAKSCMQMLKDISSSCSEL